MDAAKQIETRVRQHQPRVQLRLSSVSRSGNALLPWSGPDATSPRSPPVRLTPAAGPAGLASVHSYRFPDLRPSAGRFEVQHLTHDRRDAREEPADATGVRGRQRHAGDDVRMTAAAVITRRLPQPSRGASLASVSITQVLIELAEPLQARPIGIERHRVGDESGQSGLVGRIPLPTGLAARQVSQHALALRKGSSPSHASNTSAGAGHRSICCHWLTDSASVEHGSDERMCSSTMTTEKGGFPCGSALGGV